MRSCKLCVSGPLSKTLIANQIRRKRIRILNVDWHVVTPIFDLAVYQNQKPCHIVAFTRPIGVLAQ